MDAVAILGGTFDPIHLAHLAMARIVADQLEIRRTLFIPDGDPPHKGDILPAADRVAMVALAIRDKPGFELCALEAERAGVTYTVDTMTLLHARNPGQRFIYIVGADTLMVIETWRDFARVAGMLEALAVVPRAEIAREDLAAQADHIFETYGLRVCIMDKCAPNISSTKVRYAAARQLPLTELVPEPVAAYIKSHKLYRDKMLTEIKLTMSPARYRHTLGVEETAIALAKRNGIDPEKARTAALLHDCAKHMSVDEMKALVARCNVPTAPGECDSRALLHAAAGYALAQTRFGITDPDVLNAIRWHTTGRVGMTTLDKIIYLADMIEPNRRPFPSIDQIREAASRDLDEAISIAARRTVDYVKSRGMPLNVRTLELLKSIDPGIEEGNG